MPPTVLGLSHLATQLRGPPALDAYSPFHSFLEDCRELRCVISGEEGATRLVNSILWLGVKSVAGREYARPTTGVSITRGNSENGALPTREPAHGEEQDNAGQ
jgi:hypothetical protein